MNILVSNDDGIFSEGIFTLAKVLRDEGHKVYVVALTSTGQRFRIH